MVFFSRMIMKRRRGLPFTTDNQGSFTKVALTGRFQNLLPVLLQGFG